MRSNDVVSIGLRADEVSVMLRKSFLFRNYLAFTDLLLNPEWQLICFCIIVIRHVTIKPIITIFVYCSHIFKYFVFYLWASSDYIEALYICIALLNYMVSPCWCCCSSRAIVCHQKSWKGFQALGKICTQKKFNKLKDRRGKQETKRDVQLKVTGV